MKRLLAVFVALGLFVFGAQSLFAEEEGDYCECGMDEIGECLPCDEDTE